MSSHLSGSELARYRMLQSSNPFPCYVSDYSDEDALRKERLRMVTLKRGTFYDTKGFEWEFAAPVSSTGRPISKPRKDSTYVLKGTALANRLFSRDYKEILCVVSDISDQVAIEKNVAIIIIRDGDTFRSKDSSMPWKYAVPIHRTTKIPLTFATQYQVSRRYDANLATLDFAELESRMTAALLRKRKGTELSSHLFKSGAKALICSCSNISEEYAQLNGRICEVIGFNEGDEQPFTSAQSAKFTYAIPVDKNNKPLEL